MKLLLFLLMVPFISVGQVLHRVKIQENPLMPIVCGTPVLVNGKPDSLLLKMATRRDRVKYKKRVAYIWYDLNGVPLFYDKKGKLVGLKLKQ